MKTSLGAFGVGAIGRVRTIRSRIANSLICEATGDPVPAFSKNFSTSAVTSALADLVGTLVTSTDGGDFVFKFKIAGIVLQTKRLSCPTESFNVSSSGWNTNSGTLTATASIINPSPTNFVGQCTYSAPATSVRVTRVKPANAFAALGSSFYAKSALNDTELRNLCTSNCNTQCTSNIPSGTHLDGVAECIQSCINSCVYGRSSAQACLSRRARHQSRTEIQALRSATSTRSSRCAKHSDCVAKSAALNAKNSTAGPGMNANNTPTGSREMAIAA
jgi:hypothetical protein